MVHDSKYFKRRYQLFIRFLKENNLYEEYRKIRENMTVLQKTMIGRRIHKKEQELNKKKVTKDIRKKK